MPERFALYHDLRIIAKRFGIESAPTSYEPKYNISAGQNVPVIIKEDERKCVIMRWGLVPGWSNDPLIGFQMINAGGETVAREPSFKNSLKKRRCIVPCSGFYEWKRVDKKTKIPYHVKPQKDKFFGFAGLWDTWNRDGGDLTTFTIITTNSNELVEPIIGRMPVILNREDEHIWFDPDIQSPDDLLPLLKPYPSEEMEAYEISTFVGNARNEGPECIAPINIK
jgi:putative SOS response-associated peptidase YedK